MINRTDYLKPLGIIQWQSRTTPAVIDAPVDELQLYIANCVGNTSSRLMIIGEPCVGAEGPLLEAMLKSIDFKHEEMFIRDPASIKQQIQLQQPALILVTGHIAAQALLNTKDSLESLRGQIHTYGELATPLICTYHPADLLRTPSDKKKAYIDLKLANKTLATPV